MQPATAPSRLFQGVMPVLVTPFNDDESLDVESLRSLVRFMPQVGADAVTVLGVLGEADRLTESERERVIETVVEASSGRLPVIVGVSHTGTAGTIQLS